MLIKEGERGHRGGLSRRKEKNVKKRNILKLKCGY